MCASPSNDGAGMEPGTEEALRLVELRVAQLQHALDARIIVEQAKGVLAERYELSPSEAWELIRLAARGQRVKVHSLSEDVLESRHTPESIVAVLEYKPGSAVVGRAVENVFRAVNESFLKLDRPAEGASYVCECADPRCADSIILDSQTMRHLHEDRDLYVVKREHVDGSLELLELDLGELAIVRKLD